MLAHAGLLLISFLWVLLCMRCYRVISRENVMQRRLIAIGAGLGAGLIYVLGSMLLALLAMPTEAEKQQSVHQVEDVRIRAK
ncbi:MAG TPA: hypothetical protein VGE29_19695 [Prosthecobacter sp.]